MNDLVTGMKLKSPDGRLWQVVSISRTGTWSIMLDRLDRRPREHQLVTKPFHPVKWNWERQ